VSVIPFSENNEGLVMGSYRSLLHLLALGISPLQYENAWLPNSEIIMLYDIIYVNSSFFRINFFYLMVNILLIFDFMN
jgi:hypothetical protein